jgi:hypothetical protein
MSNQGFLARINLALGEWKSHWRLFQATRQIAYKARPKPDKPTVAFFVASTRLSHMSLNAAFAYLSACGLQVAGLPVVYFGCNSGMSRCVLGTDKDLPSKPPPCKGCIAESQRLFAHAPTLWFSYQEDKRLAQLLDNLSVQELSQFTHRLDGVSNGTVPLGELTLPSLRWALRRHHLQNDESTRYLFRQFILSAWHVANEFRTFLDKSEADVVVVFNGILYPEATARWIARQRGLRVITHEVGFQPFSAFFSDGQATAYPIEIPVEFELTPEQNAHLDAYLEGRFQGQFSMAGIRFWPEMHGLDDAFNQRAAQFKQIVPVFTNVIYDTSQVHANSIFPHMFAWLDVVKEMIQAHPETLFVIRAHPDELRPGKESRESVPDWVARNGVVGWSNVIFVNATEYLSSYELIQRSKFVMVYNSSIGLEAALMSKAVICGGKARYTAYPTVFFPESPVAYRQLSEQFLDSEGLIEAPAEFVRQARRFMFYQLYRASLPFGEFLERDALPGYVRLKRFRWDSLAPEKFPTVKVVYDGIVNSRPFLLQED